MANYGPYDDIEVTVDNFVATVEIQRPPYNYFDYALIQQIADAFEAFDDDTGVRSIVLCAQGKAFCAGANFGDRNRSSENSDSGNHLYVGFVQPDAVDQQGVGIQQAEPVEKFHRRSGSVSQQICFQACFRHMNLETSTCRAGCLFGRPEGFRRTGIGGVAEYGWMQPG